MTISGILVYFLALPQPAPVNNLTIPSFVFDNARPVKKKTEVDNVLDCTSTYVLF